MIFPSVYTNPFIILLLQKTKNFKKNKKGRKKKKKENLTTREKIQETRTCEDSIKFQDEGQVWSVNAGKTGKERSIETICF